MHQGELAEAETDFRQATVAEPTLADAWLGLGMAQLREGKAGQAQQCLQKAIGLNPGIRGAHLFLGIAQYQANDFGDSATSLQTEVQDHPDSVEALTWLGIVELGAGHPEQATAPLDRAAQLSPKDPNILDYRGRAHSLVAQQSYRALTDLDPDSWRVHRALGELAAESGQWQSAIDEYQKAIAKSPSNADLYESLGDAQQRLSHFDEATQAYQTELRYSPSNPIALYNLGRIQVLGGEPAKGVAFLRQAIENHANSASASYYLGFGLAQTDHPEEAATWLEKSLTQNPPEFLEQSAYFQLIRVYQALKRPEDAQHAAEQLKKLKAANSRSGAPTEAP
jgi:tetratricopeptide (TPR) repeat protein